MQTLVIDKIERLDKILSDFLKTSRSQILQLIKNDKISISSKIVSKGGFVCKIGDRVDIDLSHQSTDETPKKIDFDCDIIYEDEDLLIVNKPYNLTTHKAPSEKNPTLQEWLVHKGKTLSTIYGKEREGIVHRLDKPTSGAIVIAKNNEAHLNLSNQLQNKTMGRYYLGIINKNIKEDALINKPLGRLRNNRLKFSVNTSLKKRDAISMFHKIESSNTDDKELIAIKLITGRTHQIRAHLEGMNRSLLGDELYGYKKDKNLILNSRIFLHAYLLFLTHPRSGKEMTFKANLKDDMSLFIQNNFKEKEVYEKITSSNIFNSFNDLDELLCHSYKRWEKK